MHLLLVTSTGYGSDSGYDLRTKDVYEETWRIFDNVVGFKYLAGLHLNDSRSTLGSERDLHANLG
jgi:AP endonuclease-1